MFLVISSSLNPDSQSRGLAAAAAKRFEHRGEPVEIHDLAQTPLPFCDGGAAYADPALPAWKSRIADASAVLVATPIYNFDVNAALKNLIELTGRDAWADQVVGFLCAAGGASSYMSIMALANSLMLDFRSFVLPRFVYAYGDDFRGSDRPDGGSLSEPVAERIDRLVADAIRVGHALRPNAAAAANSPI